MRNKKLFGLLLLAVFAVGGSVYAGYLLQSRGARDWNANAIRAGYLGAQLREADPGNASLLLTYELTNTTNVDVRLADGPSFVVMSRLKADHSLSSEEDVRVSYPTFLPARQSARIELAIRHPLAWPAENDPQAQNKLKDFVNLRLDDISEFVLFDQADHFQVEFPSGWQELRIASAAGAGGNSGSGGQ